MQPTPANPPPPQPAAPSHKFSAFFHIFFKAVAGVYFLIGNWFIDTFTINFTVLLVLLACDFWVVKNVTGRWLVGLRWWNDVQDDGDGWRFETLPQGQRQINIFEKWLFWLGLLGNVVAWCVFGFFSVIFSSPGYLLVCVIGVILGSANLWGYFKCSREAKKAVSDYAQNALTGTLRAAINRV